jgi:muconate cycloisomerase
MKVTRVECRLVKLPLRRQHRWTGLTAEIGSFVLVRLRTDEGIDGWGEATVLGQWGGDYGRYYGETPDTVIHVVRDVFSPFLLGSDPFDVYAVYQAMERAIRGHPYAKTAIEEALLDAKAKSLDIPVYELLGGRRRDRIAICHSIGLMPTDLAIEEAAELVEEGVRTIKVKVGEDADRDIATVMGVRKVIGDGVQLTVDANQGWGTVAEAERMIRALEPAQLRFVEQPVPGIRQMAALAERVSVPLMADESLWTPQDMAEIATTRAAAIGSIYTTKAGGLHRAMQIDAIAWAFDIATNVNGSGELGVGNLANVHLAAALESRQESCTFPVTGLAERRATRVVGAEYTDDILVEPFGFSDGSVEVPAGPGWGIPVDEEKIGRFTVDEVLVGG